MTYTMNAGVKSDPDTAVEAQQWSQKQKQERLEHLKAHLVEDFTEQMRQKGVIIADVMSSASSGSTVAYNLYRRYLSLDGFLLSVWMGDHKTVGNLLKHMGTSVSAHTSADDKNALMIAVSNDDVNMASMLLSYLNVNAVDADGGSALHYATLRSCVPMMELLLKNGANINAQNDKGVSIWHTALVQNDPDVLALLMEPKWLAQSNVLLRNQEGLSVLDYALQSTPMLGGTSVYGDTFEGHPQVVRKLMQQALLNYSKQQVQQVQKKRQKLRQLDPKKLPSRSAERKRIGKKLIEWVQQHMRAPKSMWRDAEQKMQLWQELQSALEQRYLNQVVESSGNPCRTVHQVQTPHVSECVHTQAHRSIERTGRFAHSL